MSYIRCLTIFLLVVCYSCGNPIEAENEVENGSQEAKGEAYSYASNEHKNLLTFNSVLQREAHLVSTLEDIASQLKLLTGDLSVQDFSWRDLLPTHFLDFFDVFALLIHKKWHHEIVETIEAAGEKVEEVGNQLVNVLEQPKHRNIPEVIPIENLANTIREPLPFLRAPAVQK